MMDFGWAELVVIIAVAVLVIGPDEIPAVMRTLGRIVRRFQYIKYAISQQFEEMMGDADIDDLRRSVNFEAKDFDEDAADLEYLPPAEDHPVLSEKANRKDDQ